MDYTKEKKYSSGTVSISVAMPADLKQALDELAEASRVSRNKLIVSAVAEMIAKMKPL